MPLLALQILGAELSSGTTRYEQDKPCPMGRISISEFGRDLWAALKGRAEGPGFEGN